MSEQMEEMEVGFLGMEGGPEETLPPPVMGEEESLMQMGVEQVEEVLFNVLDRFQGGKEEVYKLIEDDKQEILDFKKNRGNFRNIGNKVEMEDDDLADTTNFFAASVPGSSLTGNFVDVEKGQLGQYPWETPPEINTIGEAFNFISERKNKAPNKDNLLKLLYSGVPAEAIARTMSFKGFLDGIWTPDISELLIIPTMLDLVADAQEEGFTARIFNDFEDDEINEDSVLELMEELRPEEFSEIKQDADILRRMPPMMEEEPVPVMGSFLDMEMEEEV